MCTSIHLTQKKLDNIGIEGNEEADKAAKEGADGQEITYNINIPWVSKKALIRSYSLSTSKTRWKDIEGHNHTKLFLHNPEHPKHNKSNDIQGMSLLHRRNINFPSLLNRLPGIKTNKKGYFQG